MSRAAAVSRTWFPVRLRRLVDESLGRRRCDDSVFKSRQCVPRRRYGRQLKWSCPCSRSDRPNSGPWRSHKVGTPSVALKSDVEALLFHSWQGCLPIGCLAELPLRQDLLRRYRMRSEPGAILLKGAAGRDIRLRCCLRTRAGARCAGQQRACSAHASSRRGAAPSIFGALRFVALCTAQA